VFSQQWDYRIDPFSLPAGLSLVLGDVKQGCETPGMVGKVLKWRQNDPQGSLKLWTDLHAANRHVESLLAKMSARAPVTGTGGSGSGSGSGRAGGGGGLEVAAELNTAFRAVRQLLREMGQRSGADIEPASQTALLDATAQLEGVVLAGVPGAGGMDAVFAVVQTDRSEPFKEQLEQKNEKKEERGEVSSPVLAQLDHLWAQRNASRLPLPPTLPQPSWKKPGEEVQAVEPIGSNGSLPPYIEDILDECSTVGQGS